MKTNKILMVIYNTPPLKSGAAMQALLLFNELKNNNDIEILSLDIEKVESDKYKRIYIGKSLIEKLIKIIYITYYITFSKYNVIHHISLSKYTYLSVLLSKLFGKKVISKMTMFGIDDSSIMKRTGLINSIIKNIYKNLDVWIAIAPGMIDDKYNNIRFIPNSVKIPKELPKKSEEVLFLCSGVICERKNQFAVLNYWELIQNDKNFLNTKIKLVFIGSYKNDFIEYSKLYIDKFLEKANSFENVEVLGHTNDVQTYLEKATYYLSFSTQEGLSNSLLEALAYSCYPIVYDRDRNVLIKELYNYGYYFDDFNNIKVDFFNTKLNNTLLIKNNYSIEVIKQKYLDLYANK